MILNPDSTGRHVKVRVDAIDADRSRFAIWVGPNQKAIKILKATPGAWFSSKSKRWYFEKPPGYDPAALYARLMTEGFRVELESATIEE